MKKLLTLLLLGLSVFAISQETLNAMYKAGYRFKLNGKTASINVIMEFMKKPNNVSKKQK